MLAISLLVHTVHLTGSYATAGIVSGVNAVALGIGGPLLGKLVDRRGQTGVLVVGGCSAGALLCAVAALPVGAPAAVLVVLAAAIGLAMPPLGACMRSLLPSLVHDASAAPAVYAVETSAVELTWVVGPPLALGIAALLSTGFALAVAGALLAGGTALFAAQPASRAWRPDPAARRPGGGALRVPAMQTLVAIFVAIGVLVGGVEVGAAAAASALGSSAAAGPLLGLWGLGSLAGGILTARLGGGARGAAGLALVLAGLGDRARRVDRRDRQSRLARSGVARRRCRARARVRLGLRDGRAGRTVGRGDRGVRMAEHGDGTGRGGGVGRGGCADRELRACRRLRAGGWRRSARGARHPHARPHAGRVAFLAPDPLAPLAGNVRGR